MQIPNFINCRVVDENGNWTPEWQNIMTQLLTETQINLSNEGYRIPQLTSADIANLTDLQKSNGNIVYNTDIQDFEGNRNGVWGVL